MTDPQALPEHRLVVGLECHAQLRTRTKCFCACATGGGDGPNSRVCPVCLGLPGALPVLGREALVQAVRGVLALGGTVARETLWDRKSYFYPDLPKGYQITQVGRPLCTGGTLRVDSPTRGAVDVRILRAHLEEDTGKLVHGDGSTSVDLDRCGTPLLEIVTAPDLRTAEEASRCLAEMRRILRHAGVSGGDMEKGQFRCEPNVNVEVLSGGEWVPTPVVELKNLNSFAHARNAIEHERVRQVREFLATGARGPLPRSTRGWDEDRGVTFPLRAKEDAADYRYVPEPDLPPVTIAAALAEEIRATLPELPRARRERYVSAFGLSPADAAALADGRAVAEWFDEAASAAGDARAAAAWVLTDVRRELNARGVPLADLPLRARDLGDLVRAVLTGALPREAAKSIVLPEMAATGRPWHEIAKDRGIEPASDDEVSAACRAAVEANPGAAASVRAGRAAAKGALVGDAMRRLRGRGDARRVAAEIDACLGRDGVRDVGADGTGATGRNQP